MRASVLLLCAIAISVASAAPYAQPQTPPPPPGGLDVQPPVYRSGTYVVPIGLVLMFNKKPWLGLTAADVIVLLDKVSIALIEVQVDDNEPNKYTLFFQPPDAARDGRPHTIQIKLRKPNSKNWTTLPLKKTITLAKKTAA